MTGPVVSDYGYVLLLYLCYPAASVAVHVTIVVPTGNVTGASLLNEGTPSTRSVAVAVPMDTVVCAPVASAVTSAGGVTTGPVVSTTVTF